MTSKKFKAEAATVEHIKEFIIRITQVSKRYNGLMYDKIDLNVKSSENSYHTTFVSYGLIEELGDNKFQPLFSEANETVFNKAIEAYESYNDERKKQRAMQVVKRKKVMELVRRRDNEKNQTQQSTDKKPINQKIVFPEKKNMEAKKPTKIVTRLFGIPIITKGIE